MALPRARVLLTTLCLALQPAGAGAVEDPEAEDLALFFGDTEVRAASLAPRPVPRAPATVTVITEEEIRAAGYRSVADALRHVPGFSVIDDGTLPDAGVRGVHGGVGGPGRALKVMIDGRPVSDRATDASILGPDLVPIDVVSRIEVVRGPLSALYGANAFLGVVNVVTRPRSDVDRGHARVGAWTGRGVREGGEIAASGGYREGPVDVLVGMSAGRDRRDGRVVPQSSPIRPALVAGRRTSTRDDDAQHLSLFARAGLDGGETGRLGVDASFRSADRAQPFDPRFPMAATGNSRSAYTSGELRLSADRDLGDDLGAALSITYVGGRPGAQDRLEVGNPRAYLKRRSGYDGVLGTAALRARLPELPVVGRAEAALGVDAAYDHLRVETYRQVSRAGGGGERPGDALLLSPDRDTDITNVGALMEIALTPAEPLDLTVGVRLDRHSIYGAVPTGRFAAVVDAGGGLTFKALLGTSFLAPSPELLLRRSSGPGDVIGNPSLKPQHASSAELAAGWRLTPLLELSISGYGTRIEDLVVLEQRGPNLVAVNSAGRDVLGAEASLRLRLGPIDLSAAGSWTRSEPEAPVFPRWSGMAGATLRLPALRLLADARARFTGERPASASNTRIREQGYDISPHAVLDVGMTTDGWRPFGRREVVISLRALDALDETPSDPGVGGLDLPSLGRRYRLTAGQRF